MGVPVFDAVVTRIALGCNATKLAAIGCFKFRCTELILDALSCPVLKVVFNFIEVVVPEAATWHATEPAPGIVLPTIERVRAAALNVNTPWPWPRDIRPLAGQSELVALDLDVGLNGIDVVRIADLDILGIACLCLDMVELDVAVGRSVRSTFIGLLDTACPAVLAVDLDMLHPLGFGSTYVFAVHLHSLVIALEVLG